MIHQITRDHKNEFKTETLHFALDYANQVQLDYQSFLSAREEGLSLYQEETLPLPGFLDFARISLMESDLLNLA